MDGKATSAAIRAEIAEECARLAEGGIVPGLATVLVGDDPGSASYVRGKHKACGEVGFHSERVQMPKETTQEELEAVLDRLNADPAIHGYIVQLPMPGHLDQARALSRIDPAKDADGLHPYNLGLLVLAENGPLPCTPAGIVELLTRYEVPIERTEVCIVGRGVTVGRPLGLLLSRKAKRANATVVLCHTGTPDIARYTRTADIVVAAAGSRGLIKPDMIRPGAAVLDVGITRAEDGLVGDVDPDVREVAGWLAPMPGGVGPMTIAMLLTNTLRATKKAAGVGE